MQDVVDILVAAKAKIATPATWTQGANAKDKNGNIVFSSDREATCFCSVGALARSRGDVGGGVAAAHLLNIAANYAGSGSIITYNDTHTHAEVMAVWDKAIELAKEEAA